MTMRPNIIVAPEDAVEMKAPRGFTCDFMSYVEKDFQIQLDWIAVDHHNTGHPQTHIIVRGVLDYGRILNITSPYTAYDIRHRQAN